MLNVDTYYQICHHHHFIKQNFKVNNIFSSYSQQGRSIDWPWVSPLSASSAKHLVDTLSRWTERTSSMTCQHHTTVCSRGWVEEGEIEGGKKGKQRKRDRQNDSMRDRQRAAILPSTTTWQRGHNTAATWARGHSASPTPFHTPPRRLCHATQQSSSRVCW